MAQRSVLRIQPSLEEDRWIGAGVPRSPVAHLPASDSPVARLLVAHPVVAVETSGLTISNSMRASYSAARPQLVCCEQYAFDGEFLRCCAQTMP